MFSKLRHTSNSLSSEDHPGHSRTALGMNHVVLQQLSCQALRGLSTHTTGGVAQRIPMAIIQLNMAQNTAQGAARLLALSHAPCEVLDSC